LVVVAGQLASDESHRDWGATGRDVLASAVRAAEREKPVRIGLWSGLTGLAMAARHLRTATAGGSTLTSSLDRALFPRALTVARQLTRARHGVPVSSFDAISGLAGVAAYLLARPIAGQDFGDRETDAYLPRSNRYVLDKVLTALVAVSQIEGSTPRWHSPASLLDSRTRSRYPSGNVNCGL